MLTKKFISVLCMGLFPLALSAQFRLSGKVTDQQQQQLAGASISLNKTFNTQTDPNGNFELRELPAGTYELTISFVGFQTKKEKIELNSSQEIRIMLNKSNFVSEEAIVLSTRVKEEAAATYTTIDKKDIERTNMGQDLPYLINQTPSAVVTSDAGTGIGYTGIRIRGSDATRTNVTINGIPLNDAESQGTFLVNLPDIASSVDNIQIQRGVGTSTNGAGAFGASINIQTEHSEDTAYAELSSSFGSFLTEKYTAKASTGLLNNHWNFSGRLSKITSGGYMDNSSSSLHSFFTSASYRDEKNLLKVVVFSGTERTNLAWEGVPQDSLKPNRKYNPIGEVYPDQTDNYQQDHYQVFYTRIINPQLSLNIGLHHTRGRGYYEEYKTRQSLAMNQIDTIFAGGDTITRSDLIRRRWLRNTFQGAVLSLDWNPSERLNLIIGGAANKYEGEHFGEIIWAQYAAPAIRNNRFYTSNAVKQELNAYAKATYHFNTRLAGFADLQLRTIDYSNKGIDKNQADISFNDQLLFFNPKAGLSYQLNQRSMAYVSFSIGNKEPNRDDYVQAAIANSKPKPENLKDLEAGYKYKNRNIQANINYFLMMYKDQLVLTGEVNDVGEYLRQNIPESYRTGIEFNGSYQVTRRLQVAANAAFSMNKILNYTDVVYGYFSGSDSVAVETTEYTSTDIAFSPNIIAGSRIQYTIIKGLSASLESKYVGKQFLDNTSDKNRMLDAFFVNDLYLNYTFSLKGIKRISITGKVANIFNELYEANGYTYSYKQDNVLGTYNYYYPQAERFYMLGLNLKF